MDGIWWLKCKPLVFILFWCPIMRERERERVRGIQLCNVANGTIAVGTVAFDRWVIHWVIQISIIYGNSATWVSTYVPQCQCLCIPLLEYWVQCPHCNTTLNIITSLSHTQMIWPKYKDILDSKIHFWHKTKFKFKISCKRTWPNLVYNIWPRPKIFSLIILGIRLFFFIVNKSIIKQTEKQKKANTRCYVAQGPNHVYNYRWPRPRTLFFFYVAQDLLWIILKAKAR